MILAPQLFHRCEARGNQLLLGGMPKTASAKHYFALSLPRRPA
jgi:hypothetical protein